MKVNESKIFYVSESGRIRPMEIEEYDKADLFFLKHYFSTLIIWKCLSAYTGTSAYHLLFELELLS